MAASFEVIDIRLHDLNVSSAQEFFGLGYRQSRTVVLLCKISALKHTSVIRCSPLDTYFSGVGEYPSFGAALSTYTSEILVPSDDFYEVFLREIRRAGVKKDTFPRDLFAHYAQWGGYGTQMKNGFGGKFQGAAFDSRVASAFVPDEAVAHVLNHWDRQFEQMGACALCDAPEALNAIVGDPLFSLNQKISKVPYRSRDYQALAVNTFADRQQEEQTSARLKQMVEALQRGVAFVPDLFPLHMVRLVPSLFLSSAHGYPSLAWDRAQLRAKLIRLLGYVWHYPAVNNIYADLTAKPLRAGDGRDDVLDEILWELKKYLEEMRTRYPVIDENPLAL